MPGLRPTWEAGIDSVPSLAGSDRSWQSWWFGGSTLSPFPPAPWLLGEGLLAPLEHVPISELSPGRQDTQKQWWWWWWWQGTCHPLGCREKSAWQGQKTKMETGWEVEEISPESRTLTGGLYWNFLNLGALTIKNMLAWPKLLLLPSLCPIPGPSSMSLSVNSSPIHPVSHLGPGSPLSLVLPHPIYMHTLNWHLGVEKHSVEAKFHVCIKSCEWGYKARGSALWRRVLQRENTAAHPTQRDMTLLWNQADDTDAGWAGDRAPGWQDGSQGWGVENPPCVSSQENWWTLY